VMSLSAHYRVSCVCVLGSRVRGVKGSGCRVYFLGFRQR